MKLKDLPERFKQFNLRHRPAQLEMIQHVYTAIQHKKTLCIEAPTGTGKTLSYLIAGELGKKSAQKIIISTATIALQQQLISKDLPMLEQLLDKKIRYALAKGRHNYLCHAKLYQDDGQNDFFTKTDTLNFLRNLVESLFWNGDKEELPNPIREEEWQAFTTNSNGCSGKRCQYYEQCFFYKARAKIHSADYIVTNHSLLLSDIELGSGILLPEPKNNIYIIDECHHLPQRSVTHFAKTATLVGSMDWINQINFSVQRAIASKHIAPSWQNKINQCTLHLVDSIKQLKSLLDLNSAKFVEHIWRITANEIAQFDIIQPIANQTLELKRLTDDIQQSLQNEVEVAEKNSENFVLLSKHLTQMKFITSKINDFAATWVLFTQTQGNKQPPIARWFQQQQNDYVCHCSPINVSQQLQELFWNKIENAVLLCSATVRSLGSFHNFLRKTGLNNNHQVSTQTMPAIFNYQHSVIFIPKMHHEPSGLQQQAHRQEALSLLPQLFLPKAGTLVLFTSRSAMQQTLQQLPNDFWPDILMQGETSKMKLLETHKKRIRSGMRSIIFGLTSFAEGIDLPADYCQHVIIHKLPFAVPSDPVELTRSEWITQHKLNPFMLATLPETSIKLTQYVGRLIRQEDDIGIVTILDRRLYSKPYGKQLLQDLPPFTRLINASIQQLKAQPRIADLFHAAVTLAAKEDAPHC